MSELIQPLAVMETNIGAVVAYLQVDLTREEAETETAYLIHTAPAEVEFYRVTVLMLEADGVESALDALAAGLMVHGVDCDCDLAESHEHEHPAGECDCGV